MARRLAENLEAVAHDARVRFIKHELTRGIEMARKALRERAGGDGAAFEAYKAVAIKTHDDFRNYIASVSGKLTANEEDELEEGLQALRQALDALSFR